MKKSLLHSLRIEKQLLLGFLLSSFLANAQNLIFDNTFNGNTPHSESPISQDVYFADMGSMKQMNDSTFIYFRNEVNWNMQIVYCNIDAKTIHTNGSVTVENILSEQIPYGNLGPDYYSVTDVVLSGTRVFVIQNEAYDASGNTKYGIRVSSYDYAAGSFSPSAWGAASFQPAENCRNARGAMQGNDLLLVYNTDGVSSWQIGTTTANSAIGNVTFSSNVFITGNSAGTHSDIGEILSISSSELYIVDNAYTYASNTYNDLTRVLKFNPTTTMLSSDYTASSTGVSATMNWNSQSNTPFIQNQITSIIYQNGKVIVAGYYRHNDGSPYALNRGVVTRLNANGTIDNTFAVNGSISGTFNPGLTNDYFRWQFYDIDISTNNKLFISAYGTYGSTPNDPTQCFFLQLDENGVLDQTLGTNGRLFENQDYGMIKETIIIPGSTALTDKFVFNGIEILNPDPFNGESTTTMGRLVWSNGGTSSISEELQNPITIYPNPTNSIVNISTSELSTLTILSSEGKQIVVLSGASNYMYDISKLNEGIYFIQAENGATYKFIKQ